jgi:hypothetical protein
MAFFWVERKLTVLELTSDPFADEDGIEIRDSSLRRHVDASEPVLTILPSSFLIRAMFAPSWPITTPGRAT